jgi:hypothetical protein
MRISCETSDYHFISPHTQITKRTLAHWQKYIVAHSQDESIQNLLFAMPCHSTPYHAYVHLASMKLSDLVYSILKQFTDTTTKTHVSQNVSMHNANHNHLYCHVSCNQRNDKAGNKNDYLAARV